MHLAMRDGTGILSKALNRYCKEQSHAYRQYATNVKAHNYNAASLSAFYSRFVVGLAFGRPDKCIQSGNCSFAHSDILLRTTRANPNSTDKDTFDKYRQATV
jgi:hypothetical protein